MGGLEAGAPSEGYESLLELWYEELLEEPDRLLKMLDPHAGAEAGRWASHTQSVRELHTIAERCLEPPLCQVRLDRGQRAGDLLHEALEIKKWERSEQFGTAAHDCELPLECVHALSQRFRVPTMLIVVQGGLRTYATVRRGIEMGQRVVLVKESRGAAQVRSPV